MSTDDEINALDLSLQRSFFGHFFGRKGNRGACLLAADSNSCCLFLLKLFVVGTFNLKNNFENGLLITVRLTLINGTKRYHNIIETNRQEVLQGSLKYKIIFFIIQDRIFFIILFP